MLGHNSFAYCGNNPLSRIDDEGEFWNIVIGAALGGIFELGSQLISNGGDFSEVNWGKVGLATISGGLSTGFGGYLAPAIISGLTNVGMDMIDGEKMYQNWQRLSAKAH